MSNSNEYKLPYSASDLCEKLNKVDQLSSEVEGAMTVASLANEKIDILSNTVMKLHSDILETASGEIITVNDSSDNKITGLSLYGKTTQITTTGKNLFDINAEHTTSSTNNAYNYIFTLSPNTKYTLSSNAPTFSTTTSLYFNGDDSSDSGVCINKPKTITTGDDGSFYVAVRIVDNEGDGFDLYTAVLNGTYYIMLNEGDTALPYEPYTGGAPSPSPDYPQELVSVGDGGSVQTTVIGNNLIPTQVNQTKSGISAIVGDDGVISLSGTTKSTVVMYFYRGKLPLGTYTIQWFSSLSAGALLVYDMDGKTTLARSDGTFTVTNPDNEIGIYFNQGTVGTEVTGSIRPMLNVGTVGLPYEPYTAQTLTTQTPNGLPGLPTAYTGNYIDANGQQWVCDEVDFARGVYVQRVVERVLDGTESWVPSSSTVNKRMYFVTKLGTFGYAKDYVQMSSHFIGTPINVNTTDIGIAVVNSTARNQVQASVRPRMDITTVTALKAWLAENPVTLMYALTTPIETALSEEELEAFSNLHTNYHNTTIYSDSNAGISMQYSADTKLYIDKKFAELASAIVNNI